ncbi:hypothetical protein LB554_15265 [Mesorhizobium sp. CO1-1-11]|uniref:hypothetical protein n=1 Tax=Mesorhizobium sp. CO1-1-11 TaxID=2876636 RepID=UPI001CCC0920|nr:hypothetical protein [Mesorhizobium sp. CO1-1-11]MBZ9725310.1 hypothetical protein [Mesorhizobium sp. CO1-1-11]
MVQSGRVEPHTIDDKLKKVEIFDGQIDAGQSTEEACRAAGASLSSIYRWKRDPGLFSQLAPDYEGAMVRIDQAIAMLSREETDRSVRRQAILEIAIWLMWPMQVLERPMALMALSAVYFRRSRQAEALNDLEGADLEELSGIIDLRQFERMFEPETGFIPHFRCFNIDGKPFTARSVAGSIAWYFLSADADKLDTRPSIQRAHKAINNHGFKYDWGLSDKSFRSFWKSHAATMPMLYVEQFDSKIEWVLDPESDSFVDDLHEILDCPDLVQDFLSRSKWATRQIMSKVDKRALAGLRFPKFPDDLDETPCDPPPLTKKVLAALRA